MLVNIVLKEKERKREKAMLMMTDGCIQYIEVYQLITHVAHYDNIT